MDAISESETNNGNSVSEQGRRENRGNSKSRIKIINDEWLQDLIDIFARNYSWDKWKVLNLYPAEIPLFLERIRKYEERKQKEKIRDYLMFVNIIHAEKPSDLAKDFKNLLINMENEDKPYWAVEELDREGLEKLKQEMKRIKEYRAKQNKGGVKNG